MADDSLQNTDPATTEVPEINNPDGSQPAAPTEIDNLRTKIEELQKLADSNKDSFLRKAAEFENYKRRTEAEFGNIIRNATEGLILALLPILNDFVRSLKAGSEKKDYDSFYKGIELIYDKFSKILQMQGLASFDSVGKPFDVQYHDALLQMPKEDVQPNTVIEEVERGYTLNDKVLKHAKVIVSTSPSDDNEETTNQEELKA